MVGAIAFLGQMSAAEAALVSFNNPLTGPDLYEYHYVAANNYTESGHTDISAAADLYFSVSGIDGITYSGSVTAAGSTSLGRTNLGAPDANTVVMSKSWEITRAGAEAGEPPALYGNITRSSGSFWFTAEQNLDYTISGGYDISGGNATLQLLLLDRTIVYSPSSVYYVLQDSASAGHFEAPGLGGAGTFPLTGTLLQGHVYEFGHQFWSNGKDEGATVSGEVSLTLSGVQSVPEPASLTLLSLGSLGLICVKRRRRARSC
ncbi:MAG: PEP-CTERM sorting domain-containing protein [Planctomycetaceae bacterium]